MSNHNPSHIPPPSAETNSPLTEKKQWLLMIIFVLIAITSVLAVVVQSQDFSFHEFINYVRHASPLWMIAAGLGMISFILFEGLALLVVCRAFGCKQSLWHGWVYSASDIYFSAITPSATGGQPASAYFMIKDGMSGMMSTAALMANLLLYTLSIVIIGCACFLFRFDIFLGYSLPSKVLILVGLGVQTALAFFFLMLLKRERLLSRICHSVLRLLAKLHLVKHLETKQEKLDKYMQSYRHHSRYIAGHGKAMGLCLLLNLLQRAMQIAITSFVYAATAGATASTAVELWFTQGYVNLGATFVPIPGAMGVSDYLMLDGFDNIMTKSQAINLELLSRSFSFYGCVILCGITVLTQYLVIKKRGKIKC